MTSTSVLLSSSTRNLLLDHDLSRQDTAVTGSNGSNRARTLSSRASAALVVEGATLSTTLSKTRNVSWSHPQQDKICTAGLPVRNKAWNDSETHKPNSVVELKLKHLPKTEPSFQRVVTSSKELSMSNHGDSHNSRRYPATTAEKRVGVRPRPSFDRSLSTSVLLNDDRSSSPHPTTRPKRSSLRRPSLSNGDDDKSRRGGNPATSARVIRPRPAFDRSLSTSVLLDEDNMSCSQHATSTRPKRSSLRRPSLSNGDDDKGRRGGNPATSARVIRPRPAFDRSLSTSVLLDEDNMSSSQHATTTRPKRSTLRRPSFRRALSSNGLSNGDDDKGRRGENPATSARGIRPRPSYDRSLSTSMLLDDDNMASSQHATTTRPKRSTLRRPSYRRTLSSNGLSDVNHENMTGGQNEQKRGSLATTPRSRPSVDRAMSSSALLTSRQQHPTGGQNGIMMGKEQKRRSLVTTPRPRPSFDRAMSSSALLTSRQQHPTGGQNGIMMGKQQRRRSLATAPRPRPSFDRAMSSSALLTSRKQHPAARRSIQSHVSLDEATSDSLLLQSTSNHSASLPQVPRVSSESCLSRCGGSDVQVLPLIEHDKTKLMKKRLDMMVRRASERSLCSNSTSISCMPGPSQVPEAQSRRKSRGIRRRSLSRTRRSSSSSRSGSQKRRSESASSIRSRSSNTSQGGSIRIEALGPTSPVRTAHTSESTIPLTIDVTMTKEHEKMEEMLALVSSQVEMMQSRLDAMESSFHLDETATIELQQDAKELNVNQHDESQKIEQDVFEGAASSPEGVVSSSNNSGDHYHHTLVEDVTILRPPSTVTPLTTGCVTTKLHNNNNKDVPPVYSRFENNLCHIKPTSRSIPSSTFQQSTGRTPSSSRWLA